MRYDFQCNYSLLLSIAKSRLFCIGVKLFDWKKKIPVTVIAY